MNQLTNKQLQSGAKKASLIVSLVFFSAMAILIWAILNRQFVKDYLVYKSFEPSAQVAQISGHSDFSDNGKFIYYASQPVLSEAKEFNQECASIETTSAVLGCYTQQRIYLYDVNNRELNGVKEVTAAHEMLHAAFERLSQSEKEKITPMLEDVARKMAIDESFQKRMKMYDELEPGQRVNELHSIIGTEVPQLSPELENYYSKYFNNRQKIVDYYKNYSEVFASLNNRAKALNQELTDMNQKIETMRNEYDRLSSGLTTDIQAFNNDASGGRFTSQSDFNLQRRNLINRIASLDRYRNLINDLIGQYEVKRQELNGLAVKADQLNQSIDSKAPQKIESSPNL